MVWQDNQKQEWTISLTLGAVRKLRKTTQVDLVDESKVNQIPMLLQQRDRLADVLWHLSKKQADKIGVTEEQFLDSLDSDSLTAGWEALADAYVNFCPSHARDAIRIAIDKQTETLARMGEAIAAQIDGEEVQTEIDKMVQAATDQALGVIRGAGSSSQS